MSIFDNQEQRFYSFKMDDGWTINSTPKYSELASMEFLSLHEDELTSRYSRFMESMPIPILVGTEPQKTYYIHESLLTKYSGYMRKALGSQSNTAANNKIELPTESPEKFAYFIAWLYNRFETEEAYPAALKKVEILTDYIHLYALGERLVVPAFQRFIRNMLCERWYCEWDPKHKEWIGEIGWQNESIVELIDAMELMMDVLVENTNDQMQKTMLCVWKKRESGYYGWMASPHFRRRLEKNKNLEHQLKSPWRVQVMQDIQDTILSPNHKPDRFEHE